MRSSKCGQQEVGNDKQIVGLRCPFLTNVIKYKIMENINDLTITNDVIFGVLMRQKKYCKPLLEFILGVKIKDIVYNNDQETISAPVINAKSVRLDVYVEDDAGTVYDIEVQTTNKHNLGKRTRYYQSIIDVHVLEKGEDYRKLKKSFIIFICNYDPFNKSRLIYTFRNRCDEDYSIILPDEAAKIIINTKGTVGDISDELRAVIQYMDSGVATTEYTKSLDKEVATVKADEKFRREYMLYMEALANERSIGEYKRVVALIRKSSDRLSTQDMANYFDVNEQDCSTVLDCIREHPDWNDEDIAREIYWTD